MRCWRRCVSHAFSAGVFLGAWGLGTGGASAFSTGGTVIYNTATAVYADANNVVMSQGRPVCRQAASSITDPRNANKPGAVTWFVADRAKASTLTQSGSQAQGKEDEARALQRGKTGVSC